MIPSPTPKPISVTLTLILVLTRARFFTKDDKMVIREEEEVAGVGAIKVVASDFDFIFLLYSLLFISFSFLF
jgi:hypothetical protein